MRAQVRLGGDVPGAPLVDLQTVANGNAEGLRLVDVTTDAGGLPTSHVEMVINETTIEALPYSGELGSPLVSPGTGRSPWRAASSASPRVIVITGDGVTAPTMPRQSASGMDVELFPYCWHAYRRDADFRGRIDPCHDRRRRLGRALAQEAKDARDAVKPLYGTGAPAASIGIPGSWYRDMTDPLSPLEYFKTAAGWQGPAACAAIRVAMSWRSGSSKRRLRFQSQSAPM